MTAQKTPYRPPFQFRQWAMVCLVVAVVEALTAYLMKSMVWVVPSAMMLVLAAVFFVISMVKGSG